jgi:hypothetical protein
MRIVRGVFFRGLRMRIWRCWRGCRRNMIGSTIWSIGPSYKVQAVREV